MILVRISAPLMKYAERILGRQELLMRDTEKAMRKVKPWNCHQ